MKRTLGAFGALSPAEARLIGEISAGELIEIGTGLPGLNAGPDRTIRAELIRYLLLGGCAELPAPVSESGVRICGALITGPLIVRNVATAYFIELSECRFDTQLNMLAARTFGLYLMGSSFPGMEAPMLSVDGTIILDGAEVTGRIRMPGGRITGQFRGLGARFAGGEPISMELHGLETRGSVILDGAYVEGEVCLSAGKIAGGVECSGAEFKAIGDNPYVLSLDGANVRNTLRLDKGAKIGGVLNLENAQVGAIQDERASWPKQGDLILDGFRYGGFSGKDINAKARKEWLALQDPSRWDKEFWPQPWEHCARVLREMGQTADARAVLIDKEIRQRAADRARMGWARAALAWLLDMSIGVTTRYGRRPLLAVVWLAFFWLIGVAVFTMVEQAGAIKPNYVLSQRSPEWAACDPFYVPRLDMPAPRWRKGYRHQVECFLDQPEAASFPNFNAWVYSADTLLPIVDMEMQAHWVPDEKQYPLGAAGRAYLWAQIAIGWALSLLAVAGISGLIKTEDG